MNNFNPKKLLLPAVLFISLMAWLLYGWVYGEGKLFANAHVIINKGSGSSVVASKYAFSK